MDLTSKKLIFVTGKGGVGKSICASSVAWQQAKAGRRVCLVELGNQSFYESFFETRGIGYEPSEVVPHIHIALLNPESCLKEYILHYLRVPKLYDLFFQNKVMKAFLNAAPGLAEISILGKLTSGIRGILQPEYDVYVVDCFSTGHALALFRAPRGLSATFRAGPMYEQARDIAEILVNQEITHYVMVTLAEDMPVTETYEFFDKLKTEFFVEPSVVCNRILTPPISRDEQNRLAKVVEEKGMQEFLEYLAFKQEIQDQQIRRLREFSPVIHRVPLLLNARSGQDYMELFATYLEAPWVSTNS